MIEYPQEPLCGYCHEKIAAHPCPGKVGKLRADLEQSNRLNRELQGHLERIAHFTLDMEYYSPGESPAKACQTEAHEALVKLGVNCCTYTEKPVEAPCKKCWEDINGRWVHQGSCVCRCHIEKRKSVRERAEELGIDVSKIKKQDPHPPGPYPEEGGLQR